MNTYSFSELEIGSTEEFSQAVTSKDIDKYIEICGDISPIHIDGDFAKSHGFNDRVVHGLLTSSLYSTLIGVYLPGENALLQSIDIKFKSPVYPDDELVVTGTVFYKNDVYKIIEVKALIKNQNKKTVSTAKITVGLRE